MRAIYQQGLALYRQQQWDDAIAKFTESEKLEEMFPRRRSTTPSRVYSERCEFFKANPPIGVGMARGPLPRNRGEAKGEGD